MSPVAVIQPHRGVGDLMWHLPTIRTIAGTAPGGRVILITRPSTRADRLLAAEPCIAEVVYVPFSRGSWRRLAETWALARLLRRRAIRTVWILDKISRPAIAAALAGVPERHGFGFRAQRRWLSGGRTLPRSLEKAHQIDKLAALLALHGLPPADMSRPLTIPPESALLVDQRFGALPRPWVVLGIDASEEVKTWAPERFGFLLKGLVERGIPSVFLLGGPGQEGRVRQIQASAAPERGIVASGVDMAGAAALMARSDLFIGNDSGPLNVAAAVGLPSIGLFGATPKLTHSPFIHAVEPDPGACGMDAIDPERVLSLAIRILASERTGK